MANDYFQFKEFVVHQGKCAMKVSTDACIQGAWAAQYFAQQPIKKVLDIGAGTGLLSLMLAQRLSSATISAIEINEQAFEQAKENFEASPWSKQLNAHHQSLQNFASTSQTQYDAIICNPPFFHNHLQSAQKERNDARHSVALSKQELASSAIELLKNGGLFCVLYPESEWSNWLITAEQNGLYAKEILQIKPKADMLPNRIIGIFSKEKQTTKENELVIYSVEKQYSAQFIALMKTYYLNL